MPEHLPHPEHTRGDLPPALQEMRRMLEGRRMITALVPEIDAPVFDILASPAMAEAVVAEIQRDITALNTALADAGLDQHRVTPADMQDIQRMGMKLAQMSSELLALRERSVNDDEREGNVGKVIETVSSDYGAPWLKGIIEDADVTSEAENKEAPAHAAGEISASVKSYAQKKILTDLYVQGRSLNALGGYWAYHSELPWNETANDRALSAALRTTNTITAFLLMKMGLSLEQAMEMAGEEGVKRLGHMKLGFAESEEGVGGKLSIQGQTPSELAHETIKGLLEYVVSDTSLPEAGEITEEEARQLKAYLERPATEIFEGIYGPAIARAVDSVFEKLRREAKNDRALESTLLKLLGFDGDASLSDERVYLRLVKVFSMLDTERLSAFYDHCIHGEIPRAFLATIHEAKEKFQVE